MTGNPIETSTIPLWDLGDSPRAKSKHVSWGEVGLFLRRIWGECGGGGIINRRRRRAHGTRAMTGNPIETSTIPLPRYKSFVEISLTRKLAVDMQNHT